MAVFFRSVVLRPDDVSAPAHSFFSSFLSLLALLSVHHISSRSSGNCRCSVGPGFFRFGCQNEALPRRSLQPTPAWERVKRGRAAAAAASADRPREDSERRPRSRVETGNSSLVSHMDGPPRRGRVHETTSSVRVPGRPARASTPPCFPAECFPPDDGGGMRNEEEREIKRGTVAHSPDIRRTTRERERNNRGSTV